MQIQRTHEGVEEPHGIFSPDVILQALGKEQRLGPVQPGAMIHACFRLTTRVKVSHHVGVFTQARAASGTSPLAYQWRFNNAAFSGGTNSSLTVSNAGFANAGNYQVIVTNGYGGVTSSVASLTLVAYNRITPQLLTGGKVYLGYGGAPGTNYALDRTFNLRSPISWIPQVTNSAGAGGVLILTNTPDPATNNFWRIRSVP
jgi:hypothetical protein